MKLLFFKAPWCSACHAVERHIPLEVETHDCDAEPEFAEQYNITGLPVFIACRDDGTELARIQTTNMSMLKNWYAGLDE